MLDQSNTIRTSATGILGANSNSKRRAAITRLRPEHIRVGVNSGDKARFSTILANEHLILYLGGGGRPSNLHLVLVV